MADRRRIASLVLLSILCVSISGLATGDWIRWYEHEHEVYVGTVLEVEDEYWLIGTRVASLDPPSAGIVAFRIEPDGTLIYPVVYDWGEVQSAADALHAAEEGLVFFAGRTTLYGAIGSDMYVLQVDSSGQTLAEWVYGESLEEFACRIVRGSQGDFFIVGNQMNPDDVVADPEAEGYGGLEGRAAPYVTRIQPNGSPVWKESYRSTDNVVVFDAAPTSTGGCYVLSTVYGYPAPDDAIRLDRLDDQGKIMWTRTFDDGSAKGYSLLQLESGRLLIAGARSNGSGTLQPLLMLLEPTGREVWSRTYGNDETIGSVHALIETGNGLVVAAGTQLQDYAQYRDDIYLFCVDADGELQWEQTHATGKHVMVEALLELADGGLLIAATGAASGGPFQAMLMRTEP